MKKLLLLGLILSFGALPPIEATAQTTQGAFQPRTFVYNGADFKYQVFVPQGYTPTKKWPVILSLHGSGEMGSDGVIPSTLGLGAYIRNNLTTFPAIVVFFQGRKWPAGSSLQSILDEYYATSMGELNQTLAEFSVDPNRIYMAGLSQGALRGWELAYANPSVFAAFVTISGTLWPQTMTGIVDQTANPTSSYQLAANKLNDLPIWVFNGALDSSFPISMIREVVQVFKNSGSPIKYTEYPNGSHTVWDQTYADPNLWTWVFAQSKNGSVIPTPAPQPIPTPEPTPIPVPSPLPVSENTYPQNVSIKYSFQNNLWFGKSHTDVEKLQKFLVEANKGPAAVKLRENGAATRYFGSLTRAAVAEYQRASGIEPALGYFGPITRSSANR